MRFSPRCWSCALLVLALIGYSVDAAQAGPRGGGGRAGAGGRSAGGFSGGGFSGGGAARGGVSGASAGSRFNAAGPQNSPGAGPRFNAAGPQNPFQARPSQPGFREAAPALGNGQFNPLGRESTPSALRENNPFAQPAGNAAWRERAANLPQNAEARRANLTKHAPDNQPFTSAWYADHPQAWRATHPHADAWAVATWTSATSWLGVAAAQPVAYVDNGVYATTDTAASDPEQVEAAQDLVNQGDLDPTAPQSAWLPLGVYSLAPASGHANQMVQLSLSKEGALQGVYYDVLSDATQPVYGAVDKQTQRAAWTVGGGAGATFETTLEALTSGEGPLWVHYGNGQSQQWSLTRQAESQPAAQ